MNLSKVMRNPLFKAKAKRPCPSKNYSKSFWKLQILLGIAFNSLGVLANDLAALETLSNECFQTRSPLACRQALVEAETLQLEASYQGQYPCQTYLLGLGANLIMINLDPPKSKNSLEMLARVKTLCKALD